MDLTPLVNRRAVETALADAGLRRSSDPSLDLYRAWPLWNGGLCALYRCAEADLGSAWALVSAHRGLPVKVRRALASGTPVLLPALGAFPFQLAQDPRLGRIDLTSRYDELPKRLGERLRSSDRLRIRHRSYKPLYRAMIEYRYGDRASDALFLKTYARYGFRSTRRIYDELARRCETPREVARPVAFLTDLRAILWSGRTGRPLRRWLDDGDGSALAAAATLLAELHRQDLDLERHHDREREVVTVRGWTSAAAAAYPQLSSDLAALAGELSAAVTMLPPPRFATAHRDFHDEQILVDGDRIELLDLDTLARAEPELDVGNFLAHLALRPGDPPTSDAAERFLEAYLEAGTALDGTVLAWHRASALLRLACVYAFRPGRAQCVPDLLGKTAAALDRLRPRQEVTA